MRERLLVRHFLLRFMEHDLISSNADRREVLSLAGGTLIAVSLFMAVLNALQYQFDNFMTPGFTSMRSLDDRFIFVSASMLVMALLAVALWESLALDPRDTAVLGILPIEQSALVRSKFLAVATLGVAADVAWNAAPILFRGVALPLTLPIGFTGIIVLTVAQAVVTLSAGAFGFLAVIALRETLTAVLGHDRFRAISSSVQALLIVALASALLLLPARSTRIAQTWLARNSIATTAFPPLWFVGWHETLAGAVIDNVPRSAPRGFFAFAAQERAATSLYRSLWPRYRELGRIAVVSLVIVAVVTLAGSAWNGRRLPLPTNRRRRGPTSVTAFWRWTVACVLTTSPLQEAGFWFTMQTLPRCVRHRSVMAAALAVGVSFIVITARSSIGILAAQSLLLAALFTGFHHAVQLPAELRASVTFSLTWNGELSPYLSGVKRAGWVAIAAPALAVLFAWHTALFDISAAALHLCVGIGFSVLMMEALFARYHRLPLVSGYVPTGEMKSRGPMYVVGVLVLCLVLAEIEQAALEASYGYVLLLAGILAGAGSGIAIYVRAHPPAVLADFNEDPPLPTQRLNLAG